MLTGSWRLWLPKEEPWSICKWIIAIFYILLSSSINFVYIYYTTIHATHSIIKSRRTTFLHPLTIVVTLNLHENRLSFLQWMKNNRENMKATVSVFDTNILRFVIKFYTLSRSILHIMNPRLVLPSPDDGEVFLCVKRGRVPMSLVFTCFYGKPKVWNVYPVRREQELKKFPCMNFASHEQKIQHFIVSGLVQCCQNHCCNGRGFPEFEVIDINWSILRSKHCYTRRPRLSFIILTSTSSLMMTQLFIL